MSATAAASLTAVGREQPVRSILAPWTRALMTLPPLAAARRGWRLLLALSLLLSLWSKAKEQLGKYRFSQYMKAQQQLSKRRSEPTWREILGRQGSHVVAGHIELALVAGTSLVGVLVGLYREFLQGQFYLAQNSADKRRWRQLLWLFPATTLVSALMKEITEVCKSWVALSWRRAVTYKIHELYFERRAYYHVLNQQAGLGVPDADTRICTDVKDACDAYAGVMSGAVQTAVSIVIQYASVTARVAWIDRGWVLVPPFFVLCVMPAALGTVGYHRLWPIFGEMQQSSGAFSQALTRVQLHGERICMLHGERFEFEVLTYHLNAVLASARKMLSATFFKDVIESMLFSGLFPSGFQALATYTSAGIIAAEVLLESQGPAGELPSLTTPRTDVTARFGNYIRNWWGVVTAAGTLSAFMQTWSSLMEGQAAVQRVSSLFASMQEVRENLPEARPGAFQDRGALLAFEDVTVATPTGQTLLQKLSFEVHPGDRLLICGHNGAGKSSIIRCLSALWPAPEGVIARPGGDRLVEDDEVSEPGRSSQIYYLPQKPCSVIGSLSDQLTYPTRVQGGLPEKELRAWLASVGLERLADRNTGQANVETDWDQLLSLGEQQALAIARLLYHHPQFAILDECTSAVSPELERRLFALARALGITCVTITHRPALQDLHSRMLRLTGHLDQDGLGWELKDIAHADPLPPVLSHVRSHGEALKRTQDLPPTCELVGGAAQNTLTPLVAGLAPIDKAKRRWPSAGRRLLALLGLGLQEPQRRVRAVCRCMAVLLGLRLHCDLMWQLWSCSMGAIGSALVGDVGGIVAEVLAYLVFSPAISVVDTCVKYQCRSMGFELSEGIIQRLLQLAFDKGAFLGVMRPGSPDHVENPMQRISQLATSMEGMASTFAELLFRISHGVYTLRTLVRGVGPVAFLSPPTYFAVFRLCLLVAPDFAFLNRREADLESRFQVAHTRLRHFAEPVAFSGGGRSERCALEPHFDAVIDFKLSALKKKFLYRYIESLFSNHSYIPLYMQRLMFDQFARRNVAFSPAGVSPEVVVQGFMFERSIMYNETMTHRLGSFTPTWREWDGTSLRVLELVVGLEASLAARSSLALGLPESGIEVRGLDLQVPGSSRCLARGITFDVQEGAPVVVSGPNASGKSLLGSVLLGLAPAVGSTSTPVRMPDLGEGAARPPLKCLMPSPQRIYLPPGTLGDQVCYPGRFNPANTSGEQEAAMQHALEAAGIGYLSKRGEQGWLQECRWEDVLSGGEQQRMGFTRVLYQKPRFALLDECTSMVAHDAEEALYRSLAREFGITPITLSQRLFLPDVHTWELRLATECEEGWTLHKLDRKAGPDAL